MKPILLIFGPSGVGKSTLAEWIAEDLDFLHVNLDFWDRKGVDGESLWDKWENSEELRLVVNSDIARHGKKGAVLTFPSTIIPSVEYIGKAERLGIKTVILHGAEEACLEAFLSREKTLPRQLDVHHWNRYNKHLYDDSTLKPEHAPHIENAFENCKHRSREALIGAVYKRLKHSFEPEKTNS